jgi:glycerol uptake facilitator-like aquaporin
MGIDVLYEFLGTFAILYGTSVFGALPVVLVLIVIAKAVTLGHLNPAVTFWYYLTGKIDQKTALAYTVVQYFAAFVIFKLFT